MATVKLLIPNSFTRITMTPGWFIQKARTARFYLQVYMQIVAVTGGKMSLNSSAAGPDGLLAIPIVFGCSWKA